MAFFGITTMGPSDPVRELTAPSQAYHFHEYSDEDYQRAFDKYLLGDSMIATTLELDGSCHVLRASLGDMLRELLGRPPRKYELDAWFTALDFDRSAVLDRDEFMNGTSGLREFSADPQAPVRYGSYVLFHQNWIKHVRVDYAQQRTLKGPMTTQQEIGWHSLKQAPKTKSFPVGSTDVTRGEGRNMASYYGHFICGQYDQKSK